MQVWECEATVGAPLACTHTLTWRLPASCLLALSTGHMAAGHTDGTITITTMRRLQPLAQHTLAGHTDSVTDLCEVPGGRLASASVDMTLRIWGIGDDWPCLGTLPGHTDSVHSVVSLTHGRIMSGGEDGLLCLWDAVLLKRLPGLLEAGLVADMCPTTPGGGGGVVVSTNNGARLWSPGPGGGWRSSALPLAGWVDSLAMVHPGLVAAGHARGDISLVDLAAGGVVDLHGHTGLIMGLCLAGDGRLVSASMDKHLRVWDTAAGCCLQTMQCDAPVMSVALWRRPSLGGVMRILAALPPHALPEYTAELRQLGSSLQRLGLVVWRKGVRRGAGTQCA